MKNILLIEDNNHLRENTAEILELANYRVCTAANGKEGIEMALQIKPDLIICDILMPELDGYAVLHAVQKNTCIRNTPFIFLTAKTEHADYRKGMELGADDYVLKPFSGTDLLTAVESRLKRRDQLREDLQQEIQTKEPLTVAGSNDPDQLLTENRSINVYKKKQLIYSEANRPSRLYYVMRGKVKTYKQNEEGKELVMDIYHEGDYFGYVPILEGTNYRDSAEALESTELAIIPKEDFEALINESPGVRRKFLKLLSHDVNNMEDHLLRLAYNSLRKKVADALLLLTQKYRPGAEGQYSFSISRDSLAALAGTATESLIRTLGDFRSEKILDIRDGSIIILDQRKLSGMVN